MPGNLGSIEEVSPALRSVLQSVGVIGQHVVIDDQADAAGADCKGQIGILAADPAVIKLFVQSFLAADREFGGVHLHHIPGAVAPFDLGAQYPDPAIPAFFGQRNAGGLRKRLEEGLTHGVLTGSAEPDHSQVAGLRRQRCTGNSRQQGSGKHKGSLHQSTC